MIRVTFVVVVVLLRVFQAAAQERGYLAIDEQGGRHAFSFRGQADAVNMCGTTACEVVASFASCLGVAQSSPTQGQDVWTWMEAATEADARVGALNECTAAGGPACEVLNVYCVDASAVEAALELDQSTRRRVQQGLGSAGFDAGMADGLFGPRTRQAIRQWQASRGAWATGYLTRAQVEALPSAARAPQLFAGLHEATSLPWRAWRFRIRSGAACEATSPDCERCWTGRYLGAFRASGRLPIASVKRSIFAMAAAGGSARAAARRWPISRRQATSRCLGVGPLAAVCGARVCSRTRWRRRLRCLARSARCGTWRWCGWRPTSSAGSGTR